MHIVTSYRPGNISSCGQSLRRESRGILLIAVYITSMAAGCALFLASGGVRDFCRQILIHHLVGSLSVSGVFLISLICVVGICTTLFAAGLSMIGSLYVYLITVSIGLISGVSFLSIYDAAVTIPVVRHLILAIPITLCVTSFLMMGEYAAVMSLDLKYGQGSREVEKQKKYALRQVILSLSAVISMVVTDLFLILLRRLT